MRLDTEDIRQTTFTKHADHRVRDDSPYNSFTKCASSLQELAETRATRNRGDQNIVVVDPGTRIELGLPVLSYSEEMAHYNIRPHTSVSIEAIIFGAYGK